jgi:hypothetical protein
MCAAPGACSARSSSRRRRGPPHAHPGTTLGESSARSFAASGTPPADDRQRGALLRVEDEVVRLGDASEQGQRLDQVPLDLQDDSSAQRNHAALLAFAEHGDLSAAEVDVNRSHACELAPTDAEVEQEQQPDAIAWLLRAYVRTRAPASDGRPTIQRIMLQEYKKELLADTREELAKADAKASILLAASGIAALALLTVGSAGSWYPDNLSHHAARIADWLSLALMLVGVCCVASAVKPRLRERHSETVKPFYFGDVAAYRPPWYTLRDRGPKLEEAHSHFESRLEEMTGADVAARVSDQIWQLSYIAYRKYRLLAIGIQFFALGLAAAVVALVVEKQWL